MSAERSIFLCLLGKLVLVGVVLASPLFLWAQSNTVPSPAGSDPGNGSWWKGISTDGFLSLSYTYNTNDPVPELNQFRVFDFSDDHPQVDVAQLIIQHPVTEGGQFGFRLNMIAGEVFADIGGNRTGTSQTLRGFTLTPEYVFAAKLSRLSHDFRHFDGKFVVRGEFRQDLSDQNTFRKGTGFTTASSPPP